MGMSAIESKMAENALLESMIDDPGISAETKIELQQRMIANLKGNALIAETVDDAHHGSPRRRSFLLSALLFFPRLAFVLLGYLLSLFAGVLYALSRLLRGIFVLLTLLFAVIFIDSLRTGKYENLLSFGIATVGTIALVMFSEKIPEWTLMLSETLKDAGRRR